MKKLLIVLALALNIQAHSQSAIGITLNALGSEGWVTMDGCAIYYNDSSDTVDLWDAPKLSNPNENIGILRGNTVLAIEQRRTRITTDLFLWGMRDLQYELMLTKAEFSVAVALEDRLLGTLTYFQDTPVIYRFRTESPSVANRFRIVFPCVLAVDETPLVRTEREKPKFTVYPNPSSNYLYIKGLPAGKCDLVLFNTQKKLVYSIKSDGLNPVRITHNLPRGIYYLNVNNIVKTVIIQ